MVFADPNAIIERMLLAGFPFWLANERISPPSWPALRRYRRVCIPRRQGTAQFVKAGDFAFRRILSARAVVRLPVVSEVRRPLFDLAPGIPCVVDWTATWKDANGNSQSPTELSLFQNGTTAQH